MLNFDFNSLCFTIIQLLQYDFLLPNFVEKNNNMDNKNRQNASDIDRLIQFISNHTSPLGIHGMTHSKNVERNGLLLANYYQDANKSVIRAFAYLHDFCRVSDGNDPHHGLRAATFIDQIRDSILCKLSDVEIADLKLACRLHTDIHSSGSITIDVCLDADRLDLIRCGIILDPEKMATSKGAFFAMNINLLKTLRDGIFL